MNEISIVKKQVFLRLFSLSRNQEWVGYIGTGAPLYSFRDSFQGFLLRFFWDLLRFNWVVVNWIDCHLMAVLMQIEFISAASERFHSMFDLFRVVPLW